MKFAGLARRGWEFEDSTVSVDIHIVKNIDCPKITAANLTFQRKRENNCRRSIKSKKKTRSKIFDD